MKVLSCNIWEGGGGRLPAIEAIIREQQPDAVALVEAMSYDNAVLLARGLEMTLVFGEANNGVHVAWLSRLPIRRSANHRLPSLSKTLLEIEVAWDETIVHLFATHLASRHDAQTPDEEVTTLLDVLRPLAGRPHLLAGDFNALRPGDPTGTPPHGKERRGDAVDGAPRRAIGQIVEAGYVDCYRALHPQSAGYTYLSDAPWLRLDYIFASTEMAARLYACDVVTGVAAESASDHLPIWTEFL